MAVLNVCVFRLLLSKVWGLLLTLVDLKILDVGGDSRAVCVKLGKTEAMALLKNVDSVCILFIDLKVSTINLWLDSDSVSLTSLDRKTHYIHPTINLPASPSLSLCYESSLEEVSGVSIKDSSVDLYLNNTTLLFPPDLISIIQGMKRSFSESSQHSFLLDDIKASTQIAIYGFDIILVYQYAPTAADDQERELVVWIDEFKTSSDLIPDNVGIDVRVNIPRLGVLMGNQHFSEIGKTFGMEFGESKRVFQMLKEFDAYAEVACVRSLDVLVTQSGGGWEIVVSNDNMFVDVCANSFEALVDMIVSLRPADESGYELSLYE
jgi:hypothetical protein